MAAYTYPPHDPHTILPPTNNTLSSKERSALVRSTKKLGRMLGDIPRFVDDIEDREFLSSTQLNTSDEAQNSSWLRLREHPLQPDLRRKIHGGVESRPTSPH